MKLKASKKDIKNNAYRIIGIGYCEAQSLLQYENPFAYSSGAYGWSCDYYDVHGVIISTGYSYISQNANYDYTLLEKYEKLAQSIPYNDIDRPSKVNDLLKQFIKEVKEG